VTDQPPKPRRGCFFYGCITGLVLLVIVLGGLMVGLHYVKRMVNRFTDTRPRELPTFQMSPGEIDTLKQRFAAFQQAVREQRPVPPLELTADDINALIASGPEGQTWKGKFYISLEGDQLKGEVSVPLQEVGLSMFKGRYLNGSATFNLSFRNGVLFVAPQTLLVKGKPLPETYMREIRQENLAAKAAGQPDAAVVLRGIEDIQIKADKLIITPKKTQ
jgi:hypothetical protein